MSGFYPPQSRQITYPATPQYHPHSPQSPYHPASPPPPPPRPQLYQHHQAHPSTYQPVTYDTPSGINPAAFYGSLIDPNTNRPTPIFSRLSDALFFWLDSSCDLPGLRNSGVIEPEKYAWMTVKVGGSELEGQLIIQYIESLYEAAGLPVQYRKAHDGRTIAVLDRRAFLHSCVFDARADPEETWKFWQKSLTLHTLHDPLTSQPFPTPLPRTSFPTYASPTLQRTYQNWQVEVVVDYKRRVEEEEGRKVQQQIQEMVGQYGVLAQAAQAQAQAQVQQYLAAAGVGGGGYGGGGYGNAGYGGGGYANINYVSAASSISGDSGGGGGDHATKMDAITSVATLLNTGLSIFGGGGLGLGLGN